ncbi:MAG: FHA domain-containing protein [Myxococcales bacterium]|nr:FHA domain-containing protein [Myxococcales bacterium]
MADPPKPPAPPPARGNAPAPGPVRTRILITGIRPELQTALALIDRGELREAARLLESSGAHAVAAVVRLEHATTASQSQGQRLQMLREGCARNPGDTEEGRALHRALAEALLRQAEAMADGAPRRALLIEAARALEEAGRGEDAGMIYERLGLWRRAAEAYERVGAITNLEYALEVIERQEAAQTAIAAAEKAVDEALRIGHRRLAYTLLGEHTSDRFLPTQARDRIPRLGLVQRLSVLEDALPRRTSIRVDWRGPSGAKTTLLHSGERLRIGRSPDVEIPIAAPTLSREHVCVELAPRMPPAPPGVALVAIDQGSKVGSFWDGDALLAGEPEPLTGSGELGLGFAATLLLHPLHEGDDTVGALLRIEGRDGWHLFLPEGGPLHLAPGERLPVTVSLRPPFLELTADPDTRLRLGSTLLEPGARVEALLGDRVEVIPASGPPCTLQIRR